MPLPTLLLYCFRRDSSMTPTPHLNIFHCYSCPLSPIRISTDIQHAQKIMRPRRPPLRPKTIRHNPLTQQLSPATICFIASVWIREKYENFILSSFPKRGKNKNLYFPRFSYEESMSLFQM